MIEPPNPGLPQSTIDAITHATWRDSHFVDVAGASFALTVDSGQWVTTTAATAGYLMSGATAALVHAAQARTDGSFADSSGVVRWLSRTTLPDGSRFASALRL